MSVLERINIVGEYNFSLVRSRVRTVEINPRRSFTLAKRAADSAYGLDRISMTTKSIVQVNHQVPKNSSVNARDATRNTRMNLL